MKVDLLMSAAQIKETKIVNKIAVVIDVLRASSTIVTALANGVKEVIPVTTVEKAKKLSTREHGNWLVAGERGGTKIQEFDLGNSPRSYTKDKVDGKKIILTTTNGTKCFIRLEPAEKVIIGSLLNLSGVVEEIEGKPEVVFCCAGIENEFALDDFVTAGKMIAVLKKRTEDLTLSDSARAASDFYLYNQERVAKLLKQTASGINLINQGKEKDIEFINNKSYSVVPIYRAGKIKAN
jgi:2-phosphosulfolactate phosphatase